jgi:HD-GYP domain-containing protein (c-di-GMP phosphodiesterase class II)
MSMELERLRPDDIYVGLTLPFDIYDQHHTLLLSRGHVITTASLTQKLATRGTFADLVQIKSARNHAAMLASGQSRERHGKTTSISIFQLLNEAKSGLAALLAESPARPQFDRAVLGIAANVQKICRLDSDAAIAGILLDKNGCYPFRHAVNAAVLVELILRNMEPDAARRLSALAAALTMNIAMLDLQESLYHQAAPLDDAQKASIHAHPAAGVKLLKAAGVTDMVWLDAVARHHEQVDGSGYPEGIAGGTLARDARAIGIAEKYCAMVSERGYRPAMLSGVAIKKLLEHKQTWDLALGAILTREVGIYPPGSYVRLIKSEIAIVLKRGSKANHPIVRVLTSALGYKLDGFPKRNTTEPFFQIVGAVAPGEVKVEHDFRTLWDLTTVTDAAENEAVAPAGRAAHQQVAHS